MTNLPNPSDIQTNHQLYPHPGSSKMTKNMNSPIPITAVTCPPTTDPPLGLTLWNVPCSCAWRIAYIPTPVNVAAPVRRHDLLSAPSTLITSFLSVHHSGQCSLLLSGWRDLQAVFRSLWGWSCCWMDFDIWHVVEECWVDKEMMYWVDWIDFFKSGSLMPDPDNDRQEKW